MTSTCQLLRGAAIFNRRTTTSGHGRLVPGCRDRTRFPGGRRGRSRTIRLTSVLATATSAISIFLVAGFGPDSHRTAGGRRRAPFDDLEMDDLGYTDLDQHHPGGLTFDNLLRWRCLLIDGAWRRSRTTTAGVCLSRLDQPTEWLNQRAPTRTEDGPA